MSERSTLEVLKETALMRCFNREDSTSENDGRRGEVTITTPSGKTTLRVCCYELFRFMYYIDRENWAGHSIEEDAAEAFIYALELD